MDNNERAIALEAEVILVSMRFGGEKFVPLRLILFHLSWLISREIL